MIKNNWISAGLKNLTKKGSFINIKTITSAVGPTININGKQFLNFSSNNYLGLANHPRLKKAAIKAINKYGVGPAAVRTISGTTKLHIELEKILAKFKRTQDVITFQSGFVANIATIPTLVNEDDIIFSDELNHASIIDACRLSKARVIRYKHCDMQDLKSQLNGCKNEPSHSKKLIITDGVFSMDGDIAPLDKIFKLSQKYNCLTMVDDAHGEGVLGKSGRGIVDYFNMHGKIDVEIGTLSKAFGVVGGFAAGKKIVTDWLRQRARPFLFSSAMTIPDTAACIEAVNILYRSDRLVKKLWDNANYFKYKINKIGFNTGKSQTPITPIMLGDVRLAKKFSEKLYELGVFAMPIGYPTVPEGKARIRVMISAAHTKKHLDLALETFLKVGKKLKVI